MKTSQWIVSGFFMFAFLLGCSSSSSSGPSPDEVSATAEEAYIFAYPMLENYKTMYVQAINTSSPAYYGPFNQITNSTTLLGPNDTSVVRPNNDTLYSVAWLDLRAEPIVVSVPKIDDRYYSFQLVDMYTFDFDYICPRTTGTDAGSYLIAGPDWNGDQPAGVDAVFVSEGNFVFSLTRTGINGEEDLPNVIAIQNQYRVEPLSTFLGQSAPPSPPSISFPAYDQATAGSAGFIGYFNFLLAQVSIYPTDQALIDSYGIIGIGPDLPFDVNSLPADTLSQINAGVSSALEQIKEQGNKLGSLVNGWSLIENAFGTREQLNGQYLIRAAAAYVGLYGNVEEEAYYPSANVDIDGEALDGSKHNYVLRFTSEEIPKVNGFWSLTMYNLPQQLLVDNPIDRYSIGDRTEDLKFGTDGSLEIYFQYESPGADLESNWLPAPDGPFSITLRMYLPTPEALDPLYTPPAIQKND